MISPYILRLCVGRRASIRLFVFFLPLTLHPVHYAYHVPFLYHYFPNYNRTLVTLFLHHYCNVTRHLEQRKGNHCKTVLTCQASNQFCTRLSQTFSTGTTWSISTGFSHFYTPIIHWIITPTAKWRTHFFFIATNQYYWLIFNNFIQQWANWNKKLQNHIGLHSINCLEYYYTINSFSLLIYDNHGGYHTKFMPLYLLVIIKNVTPLMLVLPNITSPSTPCEGAVRLDTTINLLQRVRLVQHVV